MSGKEAGARSLDDKGRTGRKKLREFEKLPSFDGLLFDLPGVFYDADDWRRWLFQVVTRLGLHTRYLLFFRAFDEQFADLVNAGELDYWDALRSFLLAAGLSHPQTAEIEMAGRPRRKALQAVARPFAGVVTTLYELAENNITLMAVSHGPQTSNETEQRLLTLGVRDLFSSVVSSTNHRSATGNPFVRSLQEAGVGKDHVAYVGCQTRLLKRATDMGLATVAFNSEPDAQADICLERFEDVAKLITTATVALAEPESS